MFYQVIFIMKSLNKLIPLGSILLTICDRVLNLTSKHISLESLNKINN